MSEKPFSDADFVRAWVEGTEPTLPIHVERAALDAVASGLYVTRVSATGEGGIKVEDVTAEFRSGEAQ